MVGVEEIQPAQKEQQTEPQGVRVNLEGKRLAIATPCYGGNCHSAHMISCLQLAFLARDMGFPLNFFHVYNESLVQRARNRLVANFLKSEDTHLMFIDSDISFNPGDVVQLLDLCDESRPVIGGSYSKKSIHWGRIVQAVKGGVEDPKRLPLHGVDACINFKKQEVHNISLGEPVDVLDLPTGFMMVHRSVFEKMKEALPGIKYTDDHATSRGEEVHAFFDCFIDDTGRYLSEDYGFVRRWQGTGGQVFLCPWIRTLHHGSYAFPFDLQELARSNIAL